MDHRPLCRPSWREIVLLRRALQLWKCRCQRSHFGRMGVDGWLGVPSLESNAAMGNHGFERDNHRTSLMMYDDLICFCLYLCGYVWYQRVYCWTYLGIILSNLKWPHSQRLPETVIFNDYFFCWEGSNHDSAKIYLDHVWFLNPAFSNMVPATLIADVWDDLGFPRYLARGFPNSCASGHGRYWRGSLGLCGAVWNARTMFWNLSPSQSPVDCRQDIAGIFWAFQGQNYTSS